MADEPLPSRFDVVVLGTGVAESIAAAALSRVGKNVLHIDRNDYYGSQWATFSFDGLQKWINEQKHGKEVDKESTFDIPRFPSNISNVHIHCNIRESNEEIPQQNEQDFKSEPNMAESNGANDIEEVKHGASDNLDNLMKIADQKIPLQEVSSIHVEKPSTDSANLIDDVSTKTNRMDVNESDTVPTKADLIPPPGLKMLADPVKIKPKPSPAIVIQARIKKGLTDISLEDLNIVSRKFNLDLSANFLFCNGPLVQSIIKANISHYAEFRVVNRILTYQNNAVVEVPCSRAEVFNSTFLTVIEKRMLMKFLTLCLDYENHEEEYISFKDSLFTEFLKSRRFSENIQSFVINSIAMADQVILTSEGLRRTQKFLQSLGRFGKTPFLWTMYGTGEIPQAFCRMCAVFGGLYCLRKDVTSLSVSEEENMVKNVVIDDKHIEADHFILEQSYLPSKIKNRSNKVVSRAILITNKSLKTSAEDCVSSLAIPPLDGHLHTVHVIEVGPSGAACPTGLYVLYLRCPATKSAREDLEVYASLLTNNVSYNELDSFGQVSGEEEKPWLLWSVYFNQSYADGYEETPTNLHVTTSPNNDVGFAIAVQRAEEIFKSICPDEEFLVAVPNPEDIVWDIPENSQANTTEGITENVRIGSEDGKNDIVSDAPENYQTNATEDTTENAQVGPEDGKRDTMGNSNEVKNRSNPVDNRNDDNKTESDVFCEDLSVTKELTSIESVEQPPSELSSSKEG